MSEPTEHRTRVEHIREPGGVDGWQLVCSCGYTGRLRRSAADAGEDEIAHHHTGAGPRSRMDIMREEEAEAKEAGILENVKRAVNQIRIGGGGRGR